MSKIAIPHPHAPHTHKSYPDKNGNRISEKFCSEHKEEQGKGNWEKTIQLCFPNLED